MIQMLLTRLMNMAATLLVRPDSAPVVAATAVEAVAEGE